MGIAATAKLLVNNMSRILDQSRPYAEVHGLPGAMYEQDGVLFKYNGSEAFSSDVEHIIEEVAQAELEDATPYIFCVEQKTSSSDKVEANLGSGRDLDNMHWKHLKSLVEVYGGTWENKEQAISFLKGKA